MKESNIKNKLRWKKALFITLNVLTYVFFAICLMMLVLSITAKKTPDGTMSIFNRQLRIVVSSSMEKCEQTDVSKFQIKDIPVKSVVFIQEVPEDKEKAEEWYGDLKIGDVLTFKYKYVSQETITHRIIEIEDIEGGYRITLEGDNKNSDANTLRQIIDTTDEASPNYIVGKVTGTSYFLGLLITSVKSPVGMVCIIIVPCAIIMIFEIIKIVAMLSEKKNKQRVEETKKKDEELEQLRQRIQELEKTSIKSKPSENSQEEI